MLLTLNDPVGDPKAATYSIWYSSKYLDFTSDQGKSRLSPRTEYVSNFMEPTSEEPTSEKCVFSVAFTPNRKKTPATDSDDAVCHFQALNSPDKMAHRKEMTAKEVQVFKRPQQIARRARKTLRMKITPRGLSQGSSQDTLSPSPDALSSQDSAPVEEGVESQPSTSDDRRCVLKIEQDYVFVTLVSECEQPTEYRFPIVSPKNESEKFEKCAKLDWINKWKNKPNQKAEVKDKNEAERKRLYEECVGLGRKDSKMHMTIFEFIRHRKTMSEEVDLCFVAFKDLLKSAKYREYQVAYEEITSLKCPARLGLMIYDLSKDIPYTGKLIMI